VPGLLPQLRAQVTLDAAAVARQLPRPEAPPPVEAKVVRPVFGNLAPKPQPAADPDDEAFFAAFRRAVAAGGSND